jgi:hypothetical protein
MRSFNRGDYEEIFEIGKELYLRPHTRRDERAAGRRLMDMVDEAVGQMFRPDRVLADGFTGVEAVDKAKNLGEPRQINSVPGFGNRCSRDWEQGVPKSG